jgi:5-methylcytosine-specific restriction endonuclease McrA
MRFMSRKRARRVKERRSLVEQILSDYPICQRCGTNPSDDVHEVIRRSQWADGIYVADNLRALCRRCHRWVTEHPQAAHDEGWSAWSWEQDKYLSDQEGRP